MSNEAPFSYQLVKALKKHIDVTVVCPLPWFPNIKALSFMTKWYEMAQVPEFHCFDGIDVYYPKYFMLPKISRSIQPKLQNNSSKRLIEKIHKNNAINLVNAQWMYPDGVTAINITRSMKLPTILTALGCDINDEIKYPEQKSMIISAINNASCVTGVSKALVEKMKLLGTQQNCFEYIPNGVDTTGFSPEKYARHELSKKLGLNENEKYLLYVGRLSDEKGISYLLSAILKIKKSGNLTFKTIIVGDGDKYNDVVSYIKENKLDNDIILAGLQPHEKIPMWMSCVDMLVLPSIREGMPNVILEAHAMGLPTIATDVGGIPDMISDGVNGFIIQKQNSDLLADAISNAFSRSWDRDRIRDHVKERTWDKIALEYLRVYNKSM